MDALTRSVDSNCVNIVCELLQHQEYNTKKLEEVRELAERKGYTDIVEMVQTEINKRSSGKYRIM